MRKSRLTSVFFAIVCLFVLVACGSNSVDGTYYTVDNDKEYIQLLKDGKFLLKVDMKEIAGQYAVDGKIIVLKVGSKMAARGTIEKGVIIDNDGTKWEKGSDAFGPRLGRPYGGGVGVGWGRP